MRGLLLDFGGVVSVTIFERHARTEQALGLAPGTLTWHGPFDPGGDALWRDMSADRIGEREYWARRAADVGRLFGEDWDRLTLFRRAHGSNPNLNVRQEAFGMLRKAKAAGLKVGILSNELELFYGRETIDNLDIVKLMDCLIDATHTHILKPDPRAYALGAEALGLPPSEIVFVDDQARNVEGARQAGLAAVHFDVTRPGESFTEAERLMGLSD
jgi:putative hydrolase of the HAD superfamily